jgi:hypothetical protein
MIESFLKFSKLDLEENIDPLSVGPSKLFIGYSQQSLFVEQTF